MKGKSNKIFTSHGQLDHLQVIDIILTDKYMFYHGMLTICRKFFFLTFKI